MDLWAAALISFSRIFCAAATASSLTFRAGLRARLVSCSSSAEPQRACGHPRAGVELGLLDDLSRARCACR